MAVLVSSKPTPGSPPLEVPHPPLSLVLQLLHNLSAVALDSRKQRLHHPFLDSPQLQLLMGNPLRRRLDRLQLPLASKLPEHLFLDSRHKPPNSDLVRRQRRAVEDCLVHQQARSRPLGRPQLPLRPLVRHLHRHCLVVAVVEVSDSNRRPRVLLVVPLLLVVVYLEALLRRLQPSERHRVRIFK